MAGQRASSSLFGSLIGVFRARRQGPRRQLLLLAARRWSRQRLLSSRVGRVVVGGLVLSAGVASGMLGASASGAGSGEPLFRDSGPLIFDFVKVGETSEPKVVTIGNGGEGQLEITAVEASSHSFGIQSDECLGMSLSSDQTCTVSVVFHPHSAGTLIGSLVLTEARDSCKNYVALAGSGTNEATNSVAAHSSACTVPPEVVSVPGKVVTTPGQTEVIQGPGVSASSEADVLQFIAPPKCVVAGRSIRLDLHTSKADQIISAQVFINGHLDNSMRGRNISTLTTDLPRNHLRRYRVQVLAGIATGHTLGLTRYFYVCLKPRLKSH